MRRRRWIGLGAGLLALLVVGLLLWPGGRRQRVVEAAFAGEPVVEAGGVILRIDRLYLHNARPETRATRASFAPPPRWKLELARRVPWLGRLFFQPVEWAPEGTVWVTVEGRMLRVGSDGPEPHELGFRVDSGEYTYGFDRMGWSVSGGEPTALEAQAMVPEGMPLDSLQVRIGETWYRLPIREPARAEF